jgi:hypothetical protein
MRIIERGTPEAMREHEARCSKCKTKFAFAEHEAKRVLDQRDGDYFEVSCPVCSNGVTKSC